MTAAPLDRNAVAVVTGGASGIGRATAQALSERGYSVAVLDLVDGGHTVAADACHVVDVADQRAVADCIVTVERELGPVSTAIACAGFIVEAELEQVSDELWERTLGVLLGGAVNLYAALIPGMQSRRSGSLVTISSELALVGAKDHAHYVAAKAAAIGLTLSLARELAPSGIRANVVAPGPTDTPLLTDRWRGDDYLASIPLGRLGAPKEVAAVIADLAAATWMTGQVVSPNGGAVIQ